MLRKLSGYLSENLQIPYVTERMVELRDLRSLHDLTYRQAIAFADPDFKKTLTESMPLVMDGKMSYIFSLQI